MAVDELVLVDVRELVDDGVAVGVVVGFVDQTELAALGLPIMVSSLASCALLVEPLCVAHADELSAIKPVLSMDA